MLSPLHDKSIYVIYWALFYFGKLIFILKQILTVANKTSQEPVKVTRKQHVQGPTLVLPHDLHSTQLWWLCWVWGKVAFCWFFWLGPADPQEPTLTPLPGLTLGRCPTFPDPAWLSRFAFIIKVFELRFVGPLPWGQFAMGDPTRD